jgi:hypothetical protein
MPDIDAEENVEEALIFVELADMPLVCVCALAMDTEVNDKRATTRRMMVVRLRTLILLPKRTTSAPN